MSSWFFITPFDPRAWEDPNDTSPKPTSDLVIDAIEYRMKLQERWSDIFFIPGYPLQWILPPENEQEAGLSGCLLSDLQIVRFGTGPKRSFLDYILWHRTVVPERYQLFLFCSGEWDSLILTQKTTEQDITDFTGIVS